VIEVFYEYRDCQIAIKQTMKRHKGQRVRTIGYRFHVWASEGLGRHQYISKKSEALATEAEAFGAAQQVIDIIFKVLKKRG
jgi:hypothetical protein